MIFMGLCSICNKNERHVYNDGTQDDSSCHECLCMNYGKCAPSFKCKICC